jgi:flagellar protein FlbD
MTISHDIGLECKDKPVFWTQRFYNRNMILLHRLNSTEVFINPDLIRTIESTPDTVLTFTNGSQVLVKDTPQDIIKKITEFRKSYSTSPEEHLLKR